MKQDARRSCSSDRPAVRASSRRVAAPAGLLSWPPRIVHPSIPHGFGPNSPPPGFPWDQTTPLWLFCWELTFEPMWMSARGRWFTADVVCWDTRRALVGSFSHAHPTDLVVYCVRSRTRYVYSSVCRSRLPWDLLAYRCRRQEDAARCMYCTVKVPV